MSLVNYSTREITCKIVYYGPGRSGKTTNLQYVHAFVPEDRKGSMVSLATATDRTLFFDYLPLDLGLISGYRTRIQLYTVPGQVYYGATRKLVLRGADGAVFVADSQRAQLEDNIDTWRGLHENLVEAGIEPRDFPLVIQYNKRDLPDAAPVADLERTLNHDRRVAVPACALNGTGVFETLRHASRLVLERMSGGRPRAPHAATR